MRNQLLTNFQAASASKTDEDFRIDEPIIYQKNHFFVFFNLSQVLHLP